MVDHPVQVVNLEEGVRWVADTHRRRQDPWWVLSSRISTARYTKPPELKPFPSGLATLDVRLRRSRYERVTQVRAASDCRF